MINDIEICKECHYMKIKDYSCRERHCRKCNNYGVKRLIADVTIISKPVEVKIDCPHCENEIRVDYEMFVDYMGVEYPGDWERQMVECPECEKEIEIEDVEWD